MKMHAGSAVVLLLLVGCSSQREHVRAGNVLGFDAVDLQGWHAASTGGTGPEASWTRRPDEHAPSVPNVLALSATNHASEDRFNLYISDAIHFGDGRLSVEVRADAGEIDQGGGLAWRVQDANNYYVCRVNPLESNFRVYVVKDGVRHQLGTALVSVRAGTWHRLDVDHVGDHIHCAIDGKTLLDVHDGTLAKPGSVGVWTKADARTSFDDLGVESPR